MLEEAEAMIDVKEGEEAAVGADVDHIENVAEVEIDRIYAIVHLHGVDIGLIDAKHSKKLFFVNR